MLSARHPLAVLAVCLAWIGACIAVMDPIFQAIALAVPVCLLLIVERLPPLRLALIAVPFALFGIGIFSTQVLFREGSGFLEAMQGEAIPPGEAVTAGITLFLRALACGFWSALFVLTADPGRLVKALMLTCRLPPSIAYALLAVLHMVRDFTREIANMRLARAMRRGRHPSLLPGPREAAGLVVPALAYAIRRADRMAIAMEARGFDGRARRTVIKAPV